MNLNVEDYLQIMTGVDRSCLCKKSIQEILVKELFYAEIKLQTEAGKIIIKRRIRSST